MRSWLKEIRANRSKTQYEVADASGISRSYYTKIELGLKTPGVEVAKKIAQTLDFEWTIFFDNECSLKEHKITA